MKYTQISIEQFIGNMVRVNYTIKRGVTTFNADITAKLVGVTKFNVLLDVNGGEPEIILKYEQVNNISIL